MRLVSILPQKAPPANAGPRIEEISKSLGIGVSVTCPFRLPSAALRDSLDSPMPCYASQAQICPGWTPEKIDDAIACSGSLRRASLDRILGSSHMPHSSHVLVQLGEHQYKPPTPVSIAFFSSCRSCPRSLTLVLERQASVPSLTHAAHHVDQERGYPRCSLPADDAPFQEAQMWRPL